MSTVLLFLVMHHQTLRPGPADAIIFTPSLQHWSGTLVDVGCSMFVLYIVSDHRAIHVTVPQLSGRVQTCEVSQELSVVQHLLRFVSRSHLSHGQAWCR